MKLFQQERVRVLIVDDSALMRKLLSDMLRTAPEIEVVGTARDGVEAVELAGRLKPDVITLDVEMPGMSGLEALPALLDAHAPARVVMVSALTQQGADVTLAALELRRGRLPPQARSTIRSPSSRPAATCWSRRSSPRS